MHNVCIHLFAIILKPNQKKKIKIIIVFWQFSLKEQQALLEYQLHSAISRVETNCVFDRYKFLDSTMLKTCCSICIHEQLVITLPQKQGVVWLVGSRNYNSFQLFYVLHAVFYYSSSAMLPAAVAWLEVYSIQRF